MEHDKIHSLVDTVIAAKRNFVDNPDRLPFVNTPLSQSVHTEFYNLVNNHGKLVVSLGPGGLKDNLFEKYGRKVCPGISIVPSVGTPIKARLESIPQRIPPELWGPPYDFDELTKKFTLDKTQQIKLTMEQLVEDPAIIVFDIIPSGYRVLLGKYNRTKGIKSPILEPRYLENFNLDQLKDVSDFFAERYLNRV